MQCNEKSLGRQEQGCVSAEARVQSGAVCGLRWAVGAAAAALAAGMGAVALRLAPQGTSEGASKGARIISNLCSLLLKTRELLIYFS